tara:strand:- start:40 stop:486 length:447 start_codon:yes stop_codon:yes gene_type:complete
VNELVEKFKNEIEEKPLLNYGGNPIEWESLDTDKREDFIYKFMESKWLKAIVNHPQFPNLAERYRKALVGNFDSLLCFDCDDFKKKDIAHMLIGVNSMNVLKITDDDEQGGGRRKRRRKSRKRKSKKKRRRKSKRRRRTKKRRRRKSK